MKCIEVIVETRVSGELRLWDIRAVRAMYSTTDDDKVLRSLRRSSPSSKYELGLMQLQTREVMA